MKRTLLTIFAVAIALLLPFSAARPVSAEQPVPDLHLGFVDSVVVGDPVIVTAYLVDPAGSPIRGVPIQFSRDATFMNVSGTVALGAPSTNEAGMVSFVYAPASEGEIVIRASFDGTEIFAPAATSRPLEVEPGPELYREERPFRVPGIGVWMVVGIIIAVWGVYLVAFGALFRIGRASDA